MSNVQTPTSVDRASTRFSIRDARIQDLDDMTRVWIEGFRDDPADAYYYRYRDEYKTEHYKFVKDWARIVVENEACRWKSMVAEVSSSMGEKEIVGVALWELNDNESDAISCFFDGKSHIS